MVSAPRPPCATAMSSDTRSLATADPESRGRADTRDIRLKPCGRVNCVLWRLDSVCCLVCACLMIIVRILNCVARHWGSNHCSIDRSIDRSQPSAFLSRSSAPRRPPHTFPLHTPGTYRPQPRTRPSRLPYVPGAASSGTPCVVQDRRLKFEEPDPKRRSSASVSLARALALSLPPFPTCSPHVPYTGISAVTVTAVLS